jgi:hypothetical protein
VAWSECYVVDFASNSHCNVLCAQGVTDSIIAKYRSKPNKNRISAELKSRIVSFWLDKSQETPSDRLVVHKHDHDAISDGPFVAPYTVAKRVVQVFNRLLAGRHLSNMNVTQS